MGVAKPQAAGGMMDVKTVGWEVLDVSAARWSSSSEGGGKRGGFWSMCRCQGIGWGGFGRVFFGESAVPAAVIAGDGEAVVGGAAAVADEALAGEEEDGDIDHEDEEHGGEHEGGGGVAEEADDGAGEGKDDDDAGDLREGFGAEEIGAAAGDAAAEPVGVVDGGVPGEEDFAAGFDDGDAGGADGWIDVDPADVFALIIPEFDAHRGRG